MAFGVFGFSLVVLAAIGNVPLAAVSVIYADVHFCAAILTEKQARQRVDFPVPVGAFDGNVFQNPLYVLKVGSVNNRLMHVFRNLPLASVYIVVSLVAEMLCCLEVDYITAILLPREDMGQRGFVPLVTVFLVQRLIFTSSPPTVFHVECGGRDLLIFQIYGNLVSVFPVQKQAENKADNFGGFFVNQPKILVVGVFDIPFAAEQCVICVEGENDVNFLMNINKIPEFKEIIDLESERIRIIPLHGSNLVRWVNENYFSESNIKEIHFYDNDRQDYRNIANEIKDANDKRRYAWITQRREMENYTTNEPAA